MNGLTGRPQLLKQANLSLIRKAIKARGTATRAEIAEDTQISSTTVRSLINELMENQEIESIGYDESNGGRKAERYALLPERYYGAVFCIQDYEIHALVINICGDMVESDNLKVEDEKYEEAVALYLDRLIEKREIKAIGLGVPGVVEGGGYWKKHLNNDDLYKVDIGDSLSQRYHIPVILENDLKAAAIGFGQCYEKEFPSEKREHINMAYLHFEEGCISAGFIIEGKVIHGSNNFSGELGLIPYIGPKLLDEYMSGPLDDGQYIQTMVQILSWVCGILNPEYIALGGREIREECIEPVSSLLSSLLPRQMAAEILYTPDVWHDYHNGMAFLTAGRMFDEVQFVKE